MRRVAKLRDRGLVQVETLGAAAARLSDLPVATPQRSILRRAGVSGRYLLSRKAFQLR